MQTKGLWLFFTELHIRRGGDEVKLHWVPWVRVIKKEEVSEFTR